MCHIMHVEEYRWITMIEIRRKIVILEALSRGGGARKISKISLAGRSRGSVEKNLKTG